MVWFYVNQPAISSLVFSVLSLTFTTYVLTLRNKARTTWLFAGLLASLAASTLLIFIMYLSPLNSWYWQFQLFAFVGAQLIMVFLIQFAYHFPTLPDHLRREARITLVVMALLSLAVAAAVFYFRFRHWTRDPLSYTALTLLQGLLIIKIL